MEIVLFCFFLGGYWVGYFFIVRVIKFYILMVLIMERENIGIEGFLNFYLLWNFFFLRIIFLDIVGFFKIGVW